MTKAALFSRDKNLQVLRVGYNNALGCSVIQSHQKGALAKLLTVNMSTSMHNEHNLGSFSEPGK